MFEVIAATHAALGAQQFQSLQYMWRPWAKHQNEGTHTDYENQLWWDHSFSYDASSYQDPPAHRDQKTAAGAYYKNYNFLYPHRSG
eukprot:CAMPEP_0206221778 /NCGR_PEP_ID=MMETSP0047_2-20121206/5603_1 /ASSEMBLY_ACC=CAM_ASM_000192 /TAXON_ID=195065 /ORGANISM="Chroomonas mesostigmatica_cf, Strain CCMP1168" /LENGTH=85 /DNA_ID=CAMNT_0053644549 /DNA_START=21 /DNA_END=278 /DNA_ORIENTATION=-